MILSFINIRKVPRDLPNVNEMKIMIDPSIMSYSGGSSWSGAFNKTRIYMFLILSEVRLIQKKPSWLSHPYQ